MMDIHQAIDEVMKGNEVSRDTLSNSGIRRIMYLSGQVVKFKYSDNSIIEDDINTFCRVDIKATDWKLHNKQPTLSDKAKDILGDRTGHEWTGIYYQEEDIKEFIKEVKKEIKEAENEYKEIYNVPDIIDELAGERFK